MAGEDNDYFSLKELGTQWETNGFGLDRLIRMAGQGKIEVRVMVPDWESVDIENETVEFPIDYSYTYEPVDPMFIWDKLGLGKTSFEARDVIQTSTYGQTRTARETKFEDMVVTSVEAVRFKREHIDLNVSQASQSKVDSEYIQLDEAALFVRVGDGIFELTAPQFNCVRVLFEQMEKLKAGKALVSHMPQATITKLAGLPQNVTRLSDVFKSRQEAFKALFEDFKNGRYSLRTKT